MYLDFVPAPSRHREHVPMYSLFTLYILCVCISLFYGIYVIQMIGLRHKDTKWAPLPATTIPYTYTTYERIIILNESYLYLVQIDWTNGADSRW